MNRTKLSIHMSNSTFVPNLVAAKMTDYDFNKSSRIWNKRRRTCKATDTSKQLTRQLPGRVANY